MALVEIIHAPEDALPARALAEKLRQTGVEVRLADTPGADAQPSTVAIALWSPRSNASDILIEAASAARASDRLVHTVMQQAPLPSAFAGEGFVNLTGWRGEDDFPAWRELATLVTRMSGLPPLPPPTPRPSPFFQPARVNESAAPPQAAPRVVPPPRPQRPSQAERPPPPMDPDPAPSGGPNIMVIAAAALALLVAGGGAYWFFGRGDSAQTVSLEDVDVGDPSELRTFIANTASSSARAEAREALATLEQQSLDAARDANTIEAFEQFLRDFPDSEEAIFVQGQIQELRLQESNAPLAPVTTEEIAPPAETDPDWVPPATTPEASGGGPATLTPPAPEPAPAPSETPPPPT